LDKFISLPGNLKNNPMKDVLTMSPCSRIRLNQFIVSAINDMASVYERQDISIRYQTCRSIYYVLTSKTELRDCLQSLLQDAANLAGKGGEVRVRQKRIRGNRYTDTTDYVRITIRVCGRGISEDMLRAISDRFEQIGKSLNSDAPGGPALRAAFCRDFVRRAGGNIWLKGKLGQGLDIHIMLPLLMEIKLMGNRPQTKIRTVRLAETVSHAENNGIGASEPEKFS